MNREAKLTGGLGSVILLTVFTGLFLDFISFSGIWLIVVVTGVGLVGAFVVQRFKLENILEGLDDKGNKKKDFNENEVRESVVEWTRDNYSNFDSAGFKWSKAETGNFLLPDFTNSEKLWKTIRYYYTPLGPSGQGAFIYWNQSTDEFHSHKRVRKDAREDPAWYCTEFREWVRSGRPRPRSMDDDEASGKGNQVFYQGIPSQGVNNPGVNQEDRGGG